ncbi:hypothetical protein ACFSHT_16490 [Paraburkholderia silviterrae]|uniref:Uncharacterized protein n=1 Tax=Paraburkholderia silviterrae TaxID=2528715 RepID=A0A4R5M9Z3_9BURK|nr:hypothetical protein [Paraburkholderia silviterrae]TDG23120.1 hypothetical protein EYW47_14325 [Paraburkholderia silviterrae]
MSPSTTYRRFQIATTLTPLPNNRGLATVTVTTTDAARIADLGTDRFLHVERWVESLDPEALQVVVDECKVAINHYADNVDDS